MGEQVRKFNVLCVTKRINDDRFSNNIYWHEDIQGIAEVETVSVEQFGITIAKTIVRFQGIEHQLRYVRSGLRGTCVTLGIEKPREVMDTWELYTDAPADGKSSAEEIRKIALQEIDKRRGLRDFRNFHDRCVAASRFL